LLYAIRIKSSQRTGAFVIFSFIYSLYYVRIITAVIIYLFITRGLCASKDAWYIGGKSEDLSSRKKPEHWSWSPLGGGICLSAGLLGNYAVLLEQCLDVIDWQGGATEGDWALHRCLQRLGIPLTPAGGMHPLDVGARGGGSGSGSFSTGNIDSIGWQDNKNLKAHRSLKVKKSDGDETQTVRSSTVGLVHQYLC